MASPPALDPADDLDGILTAVQAHRHLNEISLRKNNMPPGGFPYPPEEPTVWIKYDMSHILIREEAAIQSFVYENLRCPGIRILKVYHVHEIPLPDDDCDSPWGIMVMEYVKGEKIKYALDKGAGTKVEVEFAARIADALVALATLSPPPEENPAPGPVGGGHIRCLAWGIDDSRATEEFESVQELQDFINSTIKDVPFNETAADFANDKFCLCYGDMHDSNFLVSDVSDPQSEITIIDFERTNWLPISFLFWELSYRADEENTYQYVFDAVKSRLPEIAVNDDNVQALKCFRSIRDEEQGYW